jgi:PucR family transcriptional regulator, purine catabolism regulatory protein
MSDVRPLSLADILAQEELGLKLVIGGEAELERSVVGVHGTEIEQPMRWLEPDWVMLTTGMRLKGDPPAQRELIAELHEGGLVGLGFGIGMTFADIPAALLDEARSRKFALFTVPYGTGFNDIAAFAARSLLSGDLYVMRRLVSMQKYLMASLDAAAPDEELVFRLGTVLDCDVALYRPDGRLEVLFRPGKALAISPGTSWGADVWEEICARRPNLQRFVLGRKHVISTPVEAGGLVRYWLVVTTRPRRTTELLGKAVVESAARLLSVIATARRITVAEERAQHAELLEQVLDPVVAASPGLQRRFAATGVDLTEPARAVVVASRMANSERDPASLHAAATRLERLIVANHAPYLLAEQTDRIIAIIQGAEQHLDSWVTALSGPDVGVVIGIGRSIREIAECAASLSDAELAVERLRHSRNGPTSLRFEDFDVVGWLLSGSRSDEVSAKIDESIGALKERPPLYETLCCYLDVDLDVSRAARALHLHPNSLRYRLVKIEELIGSPLRRPATIANLYLATLIDRQRTERTNSEPVRVAPEASSERDARAG